jgi:2',3'-cyclic-nucleotide 2'-phosphodiesterase (5'-nucleotidase family)
MATNDFFGSFFARPTSYGRQAGAGALVATVERLREERPVSLWVDAGDFAQGGPLAPVSGGSFGFAAASELGIDVATLGNHEFDWGEQHVVRWGAETGFPLVVANYDIGLPPYVILDAGGIAVGVIGLTHPALQVFHDFAHAPKPAPGELIPAVSREVRAQGADVVVAVIHDGVDTLATGRRPLVMDTHRTERLCGELRGHVDLLVGGHTLGRHLDPDLAGVPFVQPWPFGAEVGVADRGPDGRWAVGGAEVVADGDWEGVGSGVEARLRSEVVGHLEVPLVVEPPHTSSLAEAVARGLVATTGADVGVVFPHHLQTMQAPIDGVFAYLGAGPVTEADVLRVAPFLRDHLPRDVFVCELTGDELDTFTQTASGPPGTTAGTRDEPRDLSRLENWGGPAIFRKGRTGGPSRSTVTVAMASAYRDRPYAERWLGRDPEWTATGVGLADAVRAAVA